jgi:DNA-binding response OmpR family regulator
LKILLFESEDSHGATIRAVLESRGHQVTLAHSGHEADRHALQFDCGVFGSELNHGNAVTLAGWLLAENRVRRVVFFSESVDAALRARASNLGSWVLRDEGIGALCAAIETRG